MDLDDTLTVSKTILGQGMVASQSADWDAAPEPPVTSPLLAPPLKGVSHEIKGVKVVSIERSSFKDLSAG
jgi:hypothetical protein